MIRTLILMLACLGIAAAAGFAAEPATARVAGKWKASAKSNTGRQYEIQLELIEEGGKVTGTLTANEGSVPIEEGKLEGNRLTFKLAVDEGSYSITLTVDGDRMKGHYTGPGGETGDISATRA